MTLAPARDVRNHRNKWPPSITLIDSFDYPRSPPPPVFKYSVCCLGRSMVAESVQGFFAEGAGEVKEESNCSYKDDMKDGAQ